MFDFNEELKYYQKCLEAEEISEGMSGDEIEDTLDTLRAMQSKPAVGRRRRRRLPRRKESRRSHEVSDMRPSEVRAQYVPSCGMTAGIIRKIKATSRWICPADSARR